MLIELNFLYDYAVLGLRIVVAVIFFSSGLSHVQKPEERGKSIGMSPAATSIFGVAEIIGAISVAFGIFLQVGAAILIGVMLGAIFKKIFVWNTGFYSDEGYGWHYDLLLLLANLLFIASPGHFVFI